MPGSPTKIFVTSCETHPEAWRHEEKLLLAHFPRDPALQLVEEPEAADFILIGNLREENDYARLRANPLIAAYPHKCFVVSGTDEPPRFVRGILTSLHKSFWNFGRFQSGGYFLLHPDFKNTYIEETYASGRPPEARKEFLFSFVGRRCNRLRDQLLRQQFSRKDILLKDSSKFDNFKHDNHESRPDRFSYFQTVLQSKFILCPRGNGAASIRLFEAMQLGVPPVVLSDSWVLPHGPRWDEFSVRVKEKNLPDLADILSEYESRAEAMGKLARACYQHFFHGEGYVRYLISCCQRIRQRALVPETIIHRLWPLFIQVRKLRRVLTRLGVFPAN